MDILVVSTAGRVPSGADLKAAQAIVDTERPIGADAQVKAVNEQALNVTANVMVMPGDTIGGVTTAFREAPTAFCREAALQTELINFAKMLQSLVDCPSVADVSGFILNGAPGSVKLAPGTVPVCGQLTLKEAMA